MSLIPVTIFGTQLTSTELSFVQNLSGLSYVQGDIIYRNATVLTRLPIGTANQVLAVNAGATAPNWVAAGTGTVTSVSVATANGFSGTVATATTTPAITIIAGAITPTSVNGLTITTTSGTLTIPNNASASLITSGNFALTLTATGTSNATFPAGTKTLLATDGAGTALTGIPYTLTGTANQVVLSAGTGNITFSLPQSIATSSAVSFASLATSAASPLLLTNGQLVTVALTSQTVGGTTLTIPNFANVSDSFAFITLAQTLSNKTFVSPLLGTPTSGVLTNCTGLPAASVVAGSFGAGAYVISTSLQVATLELGAATDTTLSRVSAGLIAVEGITVVDVSTAQTLTNKTLTSPTLTTPSAFTTGGVITLAENTSVALDPAGSADGKYTGITITGTAGATLAFGDLIYLAVASSKWLLADADAAATAGGVMMGMCVLAASDTQATTILLLGQIRADAKFPALTIGAAVYAGETAGAIQVAIPTGADNVIRVVGFALTADEIYFNPSQDNQTTVA